MNPSLNKRFWTDVSVAPSGAGFTVLLDAHALRTPAKSALILPNEPIANAIAAEWQAQVDKVDPATMPMTRRANAAIDKVTPQQNEIVEMLAAYGGSDLLCYRCEYPQELADRQAAAWDPLLDWAAKEFSAPLTSTAGIVHQAQVSASLDNLAQPVCALGIFRLTGFHDLVTLSGSLIIGLASIAENADLQSLWDASQVDETWQMEKWGEDEEAATALQAKKQDFMDAARFAHLSD